jgi:hypothetical protein
MSDAGLRTRPENNIDAAVARLLDAAKFDAVVSVPAMTAGQLQAQLAIAHALVAVALEIQELRRALLAVAR